MSKKVLLLKPGRTSSRAVLGDYELWFGRTTGAQVVPVELHEGEAAPGLSGFDAVIMTGSPLSVTQPVDWMHRAADLLLEAGARMPVLGVCFGHQLLAWRHGAQVVKNPQGRELGTVSVSLTAEGQGSALFADFPTTFEVQATHEDMVVTAPALRVLATNTTCAVQAFQIGARSFGVQFHPEMDAASIQFCVNAPETAATDRARALVRESPWGERLLRRFIALI